MSEADPAKDEASVAEDTHMRRVTCSCGWEVVLTGSAEWLNGPQSAVLLGAMVEDHWRKGGEHVLTPHDPESLL